MDNIDKALPMMLYRMLDVLIPKYRAIFKEHGISEPQWRILRVLWEHDGCGTAEIARRALLPAPSLVGTIDRLIAKGLVIRTQASNDRRKVEIRLTEKGRELLPIVGPKIDILYDDIQSSCKPEQWRSMINTMQRIIEAA